MLIETAIDLAIEADLFVRFKDVHGEQENATAQNKMPVYLTLFALAQCVLRLAVPRTIQLILFSVFQFAMALDAVHARNTLQFLFLA